VAACIVGSTAGHDACWQSLCAHIGLPDSPLCDARGWPGASGVNTDGEWRWHCPCVRGDEWRDTYGQQLDTGEQYCHCPVGGLYHTCGDINNVTHGAAHCDGPCYGGERRDYQCGPTKHVLSRQSNIRQQLRAVPKPRWPRVRRAGGGLERGVRLVQRCVYHGAAELSPRLVRRCHGAGRRSCADHRRQSACRWHHPGPWLVRVERGRCWHQHHRGSRDRKWHDRCGGGHSVMRPFGKLLQGWRRPHLDQWLPDDCRCDCAKCSDGRHDVLTLGCRHFLLQVRMGSIRKCPCTSLFLYGNSTNSSLRWYHVV